MRTAVCREIAAWRSCSPMKKITNVRRFGSGKEYHMSETVAAPVREVDGRTVPAGGTWVIDPDHSSFEFVARHLMARIRGRFDTVNGTAQIAEVPENSSVQVEIEAGSVDTHAPQRDGLSAWTEVNREDWGLTWNAPLDAGGFVLSSNVRLEIEVELVRQ